METPTLAERYERACCYENEATREYAAACVRARRADTKGDATALAEATDDAEHWAAVRDKACAEAQEAKEAIDFYD